MKNEQQKVVTPAVDHEQAKAELMENLGVTRRPLIAKDYNIRINAKDDAPVVEPVFVIVDERWCVSPSEACPHCGGRHELPTVDGRGAIRHEAFMKYLETLDAYERLHTKTDEPPPSPFDAGFNAGQALATAENERLRALVESGIAVLSRVRDCWHGGVEDHSIDDDVSTLRNQMIRSRPKVEQEPIMFDVESEAVGGEGE